MAPGARAPTDASRVPPPRPKPATAQACRRRDQERSGNAAQDKSPFAKPGIFTYRPTKTEQVFAGGLQPVLPASTVAGRDYLVMMSVAATQAGEGYLASTQIVDQMIKLIGPNDRLSVWTIAAGDATRPLTKEFMNPRDKTSAELFKKAQAKLRTDTRPATPTSREA